MERRVETSEQLDETFERVCDVLRRRGGSVLHVAGAPAPAAGRAVRELRVRLGDATSVSRPAEIDYGLLRDLGERSAVMAVSWKAAQRPELFPTMRAELFVDAVGDLRTELKLVGRYRPPLGPLGALADALVGHRLAVGSVRTLLADTAERVRLELQSGRRAGWRPAAPAYGLAADRHPLRSE